MMDPISNSSNSSYELGPSSQASNPAFSGFLSGPKAKDFLPRDITSLTKPKKKSGFSVSSWFKGPTYKDFLPEDSRTQKKQSDTNNWFKNPTYKDFMPRYPAKKQSNIGTWIGSVLGGTFGIGLLAFFTRAHCFNGGLFKDGVKNTWNDVKKLIGIKTEQKTKQQKTPSSSESSKEASGSPQFQKLHSTDPLEQLKQKYTNPTEKISVEDCKNILFANSQHFVQKNSQLCYLLSGLGAITHHPAFDKYLEQIRITRQANGFDVQFPEQNHRTFHVTDDDIIKNNAVESASPGVHLWTLAYRQCQGAIHDPNVQDDSVDALRRIFGDKDKSALIMGSQESESKWWDTVNNEWVDDDRKAREFDTTGRAGQLEKRATPIREFLEDQEFEGRNRVKVLNHYLQWLKKEQTKNRNHLTLITAHKGGEKGEYGHYYAVIPDRCDENQICLMNTYSMGKPEPMSIEEFFKQGYKLYAHIDESRYPGNHWTDIHTGELWKQISNNAEETLQKRIQDIAKLESEDDQAEIRNKLIKLSDAVLNTTNGNIRTQCVNSVSPNVIAKLNTLYTRLGIPSPFV